MRAGPWISLAICVLASAPSPRSAGATGDSGEGAIRVVVSIPPLAALVREAAGDLAEVRILLPPGASPHGFEPGPEAIKALARADVELVVGRELDGWAETLARGTNPGARIERLGYGLPGPEPPGDPDDPEGDPHVWLDPLKASVMVERIAAILASIRPDRAALLKARAGEAREGIEALDRECAERLTPVRALPFVAYHGGMNHLVARYGLRQIAVLEPSPGREPSPRFLKDVVRMIRETGARAVFTEPQVSGRFAEVVGLESGIPVVSIDVLGGTPGHSTYRDLIESTLDVLTRALAGEKGIQGIQ